MKKITEAIYTLIDNIDNGNNMEANAIFNDLLQAKIDEMLNAKKVQVSSSMFGTSNCEDCVEEEVEVLDELSPATMKSYVKKATRSASAQLRKSDGQEDKAMSTDGTKYPERQQAYVNKAKQHFQKYRSRTGGISTATQKLAKEEFVNEIIYSPTRYGKVPKQRPPVAVTYKEIEAKKKEAAMAPNKMKKEEVTQMQELTGNQKKIDANKNGKIDAMDFKILRARVGKKSPLSQTDESAEKPTTTFTPGGRFPYVKPKGISTKLKKKIADKAYASVMAAPKLTPWRQ